MRERRGLFGSPIPYSYKLDFECEDASPLEVRLPSLDKRVQSFVEFRVTAVEVDS